MTELEVKAAVRARDGNRCTECGMTFEEHEQRYGSDLDVHRLTPRSRYTLEGCVTLCKSCHGPKPKHSNGPKQPTVMFQARHSEEFMERVKAAAERLNISAASYIRMVVTQRMDQDNVPHPKPPKK